VSGSVLVARDLSLGYTGRPIVEGLDLEVGAGEVGVVLGPNGAGKTTTLLGLAGELEPQAGSVELLGAPAPRGLHRRARAGVAFVTEERSVFMELTVAAASARTAPGTLTGAPSSCPSLVLDPGFGRT